MSLHCRKKRLRKHAHAFHFPACVQVQLTCFHIHVTFCFRSPALGLKFLDCAARHRVPRNFGLASHMQRKTVFIIEGAHGLFNINTRMHILHTTLFPLKRTKDFQPSTYNEVWCPRMSRNIEQIFWHYWVHCMTLLCIRWLSQPSFGRIRCQTKTFPNTHELLERGKNNANPLFKTIHNQCFSPFAVVC